MVSCRALWQAAAHLRLGGPFQIESSLRVTGSRSLVINAKEGVYEKGRDRSPGPTRHVSVCLLLLQACWPRGCGGELRGPHRAEAGARAGLRRLRVSLTFHLQSPPWVLCH